jgi:hypothetical protein
MPGNGHSLFVELSASPLCDALYMEMNSSTVQHDISTHAKEYQTIEYKAE